LLNGPQAPTIKEVNKVFMQEGVKLAVQAAEKALADWGGKREDITHLGEWERFCELGVCGFVWFGYLWVWTSGREGKCLV
jgi:hypothetical protein